MADQANDTADIVALPPLIFVAPLAFGLLLNLLHPTQLATRFVSRLLGTGLISGSLAIGGWAFATLRRAGTPPDPREPTTTIVMAGPYQLSRNPIYVSFTLLYAGLSFLINTVWPMLLLPIALLVIKRGVIDPEERYLERRFAEDYLPYKARVRRWM